MVSDLRQLTIHLALLTTLILLGSCNIVGPAAYLIEGPGTIEPMFVLEDRPTVVFVDDRRSLMQRVTFRRAMAEQVTRDLMVHAEMTPDNMIAPADAIALARAHDAHNKLLPIDAVGRELGAAQIIYVEVVAFQGGMEDGTPVPVGSAHVRVLDVEQRQRLFPTDNDDMDAPRTFHPVHSRLPARTDSGGYQNNAARIAMFTTLAQKMGNDVGKLFYEHERIDLGGNLNPR